MLTKAHQFSSTQIVRLISNPLRKFIVVAYASDLIKLLKRRESPLPKPVATAEIVLCIDTDTLKVQEISEDLLEISSEDNKANELKPKGFMAPGLPEF